MKTCYNGDKIFSLKIFLFRNKNMSKNSTFSIISIHLPLPCKTFETDLSIFQSGQKHSSFLMKTSKYLLTDPDQMAQMYWLILLCTGLLAARR
jgi:hypothetical protein